MTRNQRLILIIILLLIVIFNWKVIFLIMTGGPGYFAAIHKNGIRDSPYLTYQIYPLSGEDFEDHPAWTEMIIRQKKVLRASESILDVIPGTIWGPEYAGLRISPEEDYFLRITGSGTLYEFNGSYYQIVMTQ